MLQLLKAQIARHTAPSRRHLTPEILLRLITPACPLWSGPVEDSPFADPYWAFYWPGAGDCKPCIAEYLLRHHNNEVVRGLDINSSNFITHFTSGNNVTGGDFVVICITYILDNKQIIKNRSVLDVGCGCGAGSIAAAMMEAKRVLANDIDEVLASTINAESNRIHIETSTENMIGDKCDDFDVILIGDMFYDEEFANTLFGWLKKLAENGKTVLIGDPGRHGLTHSRRRQLTLLATYELAEETCLQNHGYTETTIYGC